MRWLLCFVTMMFIGFVSSADEAPRPIQRRIPPPGIDSGDELIKLKAELIKVSEQSNDLHDNWLFPDIGVYLKAVDFAIRHNEFYAKSDYQKAYDALATARQRTKQLRQNKTPWTTSSGRVVRGYRSSIDSSLQPYGLEIPESFDFSRPAPLYVWLHGRGDKVTDLHFIDQRQKRAGRIAPQDAMVLHPFGRHCMGFKSAGEIDVLDAVNHVQSQYKVDPDRIVLMGFSMGGAGAWHIGAHYPDRWVAMSPGAGFAETAQYNRLQEKDYPAWYIQRLWGLYDVPGYTRNLFNLPVVAYSGENDRQIQAARVMEHAFKDHKRTLPHIIGPGMGHKYHPDSLAEIMKRMESAVVERRPRLPKKVFVQTRTLRYPGSAWVKAMGLIEHWQDSRIDAEMLSPRKIKVTTRNVNVLRLDAWSSRPDVDIQIDGQEISVKGTSRDDTFIDLAHDGKQWRVANDWQSQLRKRPHLQGPIDDAFMAPFLVVTPTGESKHSAVQEWVEFGLNHFRARWQALYRGELREKSDTEVTEDDIAKYNLVLWGDRNSNRLIGDISKNLPIKWTNDSIGVGDLHFSADQHVPLLIFPNPNAPSKYIVINSGPTHREGHDRTNSLQNPKLPDWAVIDISQAPDELTPGKVVAADFFDEQWRLKTK